MTSALMRFFHMLHRDFSTIIPTCPLGLGRHRKMGNSGSRRQNTGRELSRAARGGGGGPTIRCYQCQGIFTTTQPGQPGHVRCPYCSTINGVPAASAAASPVAALNAAAAASASEPAAMARQEQLLRRLQAREITPLELLILREFVEHLQQTRAGASTSEIDNFTASWVVDDVSKLPEELHTCCVCLEEVCCGADVRTLPCLHTFHSACAEEWLRKKKVCPLCQFQIDGPSEEGGGEAVAGLG